MSNLPILEDEAGCASFESTLALLDDTLSGDELTAAQEHARACALCGPMVTSWEPVGTLLRDHFDSAAERAKPDLSGVAMQVMTRIDPPKPVAQPGWVSRLWTTMRPTQRYYAFAAAAATVVLVAVPAVRYGGAPAHSCDLDTDVHHETADVAGQSGFHVHELSFGAENGSVTTADEELQVIWVNEPDGA